MADYLPPIIQEFIASADRYIGPVRDMAAVTETAAKAVSNLVDQIEKLDFAAVASTAGELSDKLGDVAGSAKDARTAILGVSTASGGLQRSLGNLNEKIGTLMGALVALDGELDRKRDALKDVGLASAVVAAGLATLGKDTADTGNAARDATNSFRIWGTGIRLTGNAIHWLITGTTEFLAVGIPAVIAAAAGAFVLYQGVVEEVTFRMLALYTTTEATAALLGRTSGDVLGLGHAWQTAQDAANPLAWELLGAYINGAKTSMHGLADAGLQVDQIFTTFAAKLDVDMRQGVQQITGLLSHMVPDLTEFGQIFGNLGHAILNLASDMPGLAEVLLQVAAAISTVIRWISELPAWIITTFFAFEEFTRWGGLVFRMLASLTASLVDFAVSVGAVGLAGNLANLSNGLSIAGAGFKAWIGYIRDAGVALIAFAQEVVITYTELGFLDATMALLGAITPFAWVVIGIAALAALTIWLGRTKSSAQSLADTLDAKLASASSVNTIAVATQNIRQLDQALQQTGAAGAGAVSVLTGKMAGLGGTTRNTGSAWAYLGNTLLAALGGNVAGTPLAQLTSSLKLQQTAIGMTINGANKLSRVYGTTFAQSLALADAAGVKLGTTQIILGKNANIAGQQVENLVTGYKRMDQVGGTLGADMNVLAIQSGLADTQVSKLNQGWDQFIQNSASITSTVATMNEGLENMGHVVADTADHLAGISGGATLTVKQFAEAMKGFTGVGAQVWSNFDQGISNAQQNMDALRIATAYGGVQLKDFRGAAAYAVAGLLPFASHSRTAVEQLSALAQEAGGPATGSFTRLKQWVDNNKVSAAQYAKIIQQLTGQMSNAGAAAKEFASTLQSSMQQEIADALLGTEHLNQTVGQFSKAVQDSGGTITSTSPAYRAMFDFFTASGLSASQATAEIKLMEGQIDGTAGAASRSTGPLGALSTAEGGVAGQARTAAVAVQSLAAQIAALKSKTIYIDVVQQGAGINVQGGTPGTRVTGGAGGVGPTGGITVVHNHVAGSVVSEQQLIRMSQAGINRKTIRNGSTQLFISGRSH